MQIAGRSIFLWCLFMVGGPRFSGADECAVKKGAVLTGTDVVAYRQLAPGSPSADGRAIHHSDYGDFSFNFADNDNLLLFAANASYYAPQWGGFCSWSIAANGANFSAHELGAKANTDVWAIVDTRLYLFKDCLAMNKFIYGVDSQHNLAALIAAGSATWSRIEAEFKSDTAIGIAPPIFNTECTGIAPGDTLDYDDCISPIGTIFSADGEVIDLPSSVPTGTPPPSVSYKPSQKPISSPSHPPSHAPTPPPSFMPSITPSPVPTHAPTSPPTPIPSIMPTPPPSHVPSSGPSAYKHPTQRPHFPPSKAPSASPAVHVSSLLPVHTPTMAPVGIPTATVDNAMFSPWTLFGMILVIGCLVISAGAACSLHPKPRDYEAEGEKDGLAFSDELNDDDEYESAFIEDAQPGDVFDFSSSDEDDDYPTAVRNKLTGSRKDRKRSANGRSEIELQSTTKVSAMNDDSLLDADASTRGSPAYRASEVAIANLLELGPGEPGATI